MKSAYGRKIPAPDHELTSVEGGSPMGELLRRYWQPVCTSEELGDLPRKVKILCEEVVVFRDGKVGLGSAFACTVLVVVIALATVFTRTLDRFQRGSTAGGNA